MTAEPDALTKALGVIAPTLDDPVPAAGSEVLGGPVGPRSRASRSFWKPVQIVIGLAALGFLLGLFTKIPCASTGWASPGNYTHLCYSDIPPLFSLRGFSELIFPYIGTPPPGVEQVEYPVLTGLFAFFAAVITPNKDATWFFFINAIMLATCLIVAVAATALTVRRRPWDAAMVAIAPGTILCAVINWDLLAVALTSLALCLWAKKYPTWAGIVLGLAAAAKFYPVMLLGPLLILCWRAARMTAFGKALGGFAVAWLAINVPFILINFDGWFRFYSFSSDRGEDFGSIWLVLTSFGHHVDSTELVNLLATVMFLVCCVGVALLGVFAPRRPRLASLCFLVIAAFLLTNKVYSPQYVLWLIPLAALARPRWRDFMIWQACETVYFVGIWLYLASLSEGGKGLPLEAYRWTIIIHIAGTLYLSAMIIRDALAPAHDPVRSDAWPEDDDDPGGGVLDGAPDRGIYRVKA